MDKSSQIVGPNGKPVETPEVVLTKEQHLEKLKKEVTEIMDSPAFQEYATAMVLGTQLYAWAHHYIIRELPGTTPAKLAVIGTVNRSMMDAKGNPHPFDEVAMCKNIENQLKFISDKTAAHAEAVAKLQAEKEPQLTVVRGGAEKEPQLTVVRGWQG